MKSTKTMQKIRRKKGEKNNNKKANARKDKQDEETRRDERGSHKTETDAWRKRIHTVTRVQHEEGYSLLIIDKLSIL